MTAPTAEDSVRSPIFGALDSLRALGIVTVSFGHLFLLDELIMPSFPVRLMYNTGFMFGLAFFVLSGFLLFRPFAAALLDARPMPRAGKFLWRRVWRILPAYWAALTFALIFDDQIRKPVSAFGYAALYLCIYPYFPSLARLGMVQAWTICAELVFYAALPFSAAWLSRRTSRRPDMANRARYVAYVLVAVMVIMVPVRLGLSIIGTNFTEPDYMVNYSFYNYIDWFALGMLIALGREWWVRGGRVPSFVTRMITYPWFGLTIAAGFWWLALQIHHVPVPVANYPSSAQYTLRLVLLSFAVASMIIPFAFRVNVPGRASQLLQGPALSFAARVSYGFFCWHFAIIHVADQIFGVVDPGPQLFMRWVMVAIVTFAVGTASLYLIERPSVAYSERLWASRVQPAIDRRAAKRRGPGDDAGSGPASPGPDAAESVGSTTSGDTNASS